MLELPTGTRLRITLTPKSADEEALVLASTFESENDRQQLVISAPIHKEAVFPMPLQESCALSYADDLAVYSCECRVDERFEKGGLPYVALTVMSGLRRVQRRENFRLRMMLPCSVQRIPQGEDGQPEARVFPCQTIDLSGGGAAFYIKEQLTRGEKVEFTVRIAEYGTLTVDATVCWTRSHADAAGGSRAYSAGVLFNFASTRDRENLSKYVFRQQLKQRREGLLSSYC